MSNLYDTFQWKTQPKLEPLAAVMLPTDQTVKTLDKPLYTGVILGLFSSVGSAIGTRYLSGGTSWQPRGPAGEEHDRGYPNRW